MSEPAIEGTIVDDEPVRTALAVVQHAKLAVTPEVGADELVARLDVIRSAMQTAMVDGIDYGKIPGVDKPTLLKPGAEKLGVLFQLDVQIDNEKTWGPGDHLTVNSKATVFHAPTGTRQGYGEGLCTTRERKYGKRLAERQCPTCEQATIKRSKFPPRDNPSAEPGWYCFAKIGGCGANFPAGDQRIEGQTVGEVVNPDLPDLWNTVLKMSEKRARVDAILAVTGASALFTQDAEDLEPPAPPQPPAARDVARQVREEAKATDVPAHTSEFTHAPERQTIDPAFANDIADQAAAKCSTVGEFRAALAEAKIAAPDDLRSKDARLAFLSTLTVAEGSRLTVVLGGAQDGPEGAQEAAA